MATLLGTYYGNSTGPSSNKFRVVVQYQVTQTDPLKGYYLQRRCYVQVTDGQSSNFTSNLTVSWTTTKYALSTAGNYAIQAWQNIGWVAYGKAVEYEAYAYYTSYSGSLYKTTATAKYTVPYAIVTNYYSNYATKAFSGALNSVGADKNVIVRTAAVVAGSSVPDGLWDYSYEGASTYLARAGYEATGYWGTTTSGGTLVSETKAFSSAANLASAFGKDLTKGNVTLNLYAQWKRTSYTVTYNANGGSGAPASQSKTHGENLILSNTLPVLSGFKCIGWSTSRNADQAEYLPGGTYSADKDLTLYAVWKKNELMTIFKDGTAIKGQPGMDKKMGAPWIRVNGIWKKGGV